MGSTENLLCFIEFIQFEKYILLNDDNGGDTQKHLMCKRVIFSESTPASLIVFDLDDSISEKAKKLYHKYVREDCEYEINIGYRERFKFKRYITDNEFKKHISDSDFDYGALINVVDSCLI